MKSRNVLIFAKDSPFGESDVREKLRLSLGLSAGYKEHNVNLVLTGDAVYLVNVPEESSGILKFIKSFKYNNANIFVDTDSLSWRNLVVDSIPAPFKKLDRDNMSKLLKESDLTISL